MIQKFDFGQEAITYIRQELSYGKSLAEYIRLSANLDAGHVTAFLPEGSRTEQRLNFEYGGLITTPESRQETANFVLKFLTEASDSYVIVEEEIATLDNQTNIQESNEQFFVYEAEMYFFLTSHSQSMESIAYMLRLASGYPGIGVLVSHGSALNIQDRSSVGADTLEEIAMNTQHILIEAYDGEAFLIWSRD